VEPDAQGGGIGNLLLEPALARADSEGTSCYLETPFEQTHAFYGKHGFQLSRELHPISAAPPVWTMARPPRSADRAES
jgi:GNAT superfamily N-acetyltransferase